MNSKQADNSNPFNVEKDADLKAMSRSEQKLPSLASADPKNRDQKLEGAISPVKPVTLFSNNSMAEMNTINSLGFEGTHIKSPAQNSRKSQVTLKTIEFNQKSVSAMTSSGQKDNVKVVIRVRPQNQREKATGGQKSCILVESEEKIVLDRGAEQKMFTFDYVADENTTQEDIFVRMAKPIADSCLQGYNGTIFAYGQTGSGKTYTIQGPAFTSASGEEQIISNLNASGALFEGRGLMQRSFEHIFACMENERQEAEDNGSEVKYLVKTSYLEIYNEQILDLLDPSQTNLHIREDIKTGVYVEGLVEEPVTCVKDMIALITKGSRNRHVGSTSMNKESSRSHSVLTTQIESKCMTASGVWQMRSSCFHIIDLAGSERSKQTNAEGQRLKEAGMINKSLSALGIVINSLVEISEGKTRHVHYRDSKLTFLLRDSLGGNSKTVIIANITQAATSASETLSTLKFAQRAKLIKNKAVINEESSGTIALLKTEIRRLKQEIIEISNDRLQMEHQLMSSREEVASICALCMAEKMTNNNDPQIFQEEMLLQENFRSKGSVASTDTKKYQQRVVYLENLLAANLDNLTTSQKYQEAEQAKKAQSLKWFQQAIDSFEKQSQRDKMIIKFRDQRIQKLEQAIASNDPALYREVVTDQISTLTQERDSWRDQCEKLDCVQAAKLFAEKSDLVRQKEALEKEVGQSPDSLSAQVRSLNELNDNLNQYLKDHCEQQVQDSVFELEKLKTNLQEEIESLKAQLAQNTATAENVLEQAKSKHEQEVTALQDKISQMYEKHAAEKSQLQQEASLQIDEIKVQLQSVNQGTEFQFTRLKIEQLEKQNELQALIDAKDKQLHARDESLALLDLTARQLRESIEKSTLCHIQTTEELNSKLSNLQISLSQERESSSKKLKHLKDELSREMTQLQKDLIVEQSQGDLLRDQDTEQKQKISELERANEDLQKQMLVGLETIQELRSQVSSIEIKLQATAKENFVKLSVALQNEQQWREHSQAMSKKAAEIEAALTKDLCEYRQAKEEQIEDLERKLQLESQAQQLLLSQNSEKFSRLIESLEAKNGEISASLLKQNSQVNSLQSQLAQTEQQQELIAAELKDKQQLLDASEDLICDLKHKISQLTVQIQELEARSKRMEQINQDQQQELRQVYEQRMIGNEKDFQDKLNLLRDGLLKAESNCQSLSAQLTNQKTDFDLQKQRALNQTKQVELENQNLTAQVFTLEQEVERKTRNYQQKLEQIEVTVKQTLENEKAIAFEQAETHLREALQRREEDVRIALLQSFNQQTQEIQRQHETDKLNARKRSDYKLSQIVNNFVDLIKQVKTEFNRLKKDTERHLRWENVAPSQAEISQLVQIQMLSRTEKEGKHIWEIQSLKALHSKALQAQQAVQTELKERNSDLGEQLNEYKGLTTQLQVEKQNTLKAMEQLSEKLRIATLALGELKQEKQESEIKLSQESYQKFQDKESEVQALTVELETLRSNLMQKTVDLTKQRSKTLDVQEQLKQSKETINDLLNKQGSMMDDVQARLASYGTESDLWKQKVADQKKEIAEIRKERNHLQQKYEIVVFQSQEIIRGRDLEAESRKTIERQRQQELEAAKAESAQHQLTISKQEGEIKDVVKLLKKYSDDNKQLLWENEQLKQQNEVQAGHQNLQQKIQHHQNLKEEYNKLRVENYNLKEDMRKKLEQNEQLPSSRQSQEELERAKRDCMAISSKVDSLLQVLITLPGSAHFIKHAPQLDEQLRKASLAASSIQQAVFNCHQKLSVAMELIGHLARQMKAQMQQQSQSNVNHSKPQVGQQRVSSSNGLRQQDTNKRTGVLYLNPNKGPL